LHSQKSLSTNVESEVVPVSVCDGPQDADAQPRGVVHHREFSRGASLV
jgi:hypothetical protein